MTTLNWILIGIIYLLMMIILYKPFKRISENEWTDYPMLQIFVWPFMLCGICLIALTEGFKIIYRK